METIGAVVVTYESEDVIGPCLDALRSVGSVVVIDNASSDQTVREAHRRPWARVVPNPDNRGFAAGANQGAAELSHPNLLILNPDVVVEGGLEELVKACQEHGAAAGALLGEDGQPQRGFTIRRLPTPAALSFEALGINAIWRSNPVNRRYRYLGRDLSIPGEVEQPAGAFLMIRRDVFDRAGGFDESFVPAWFEDVDLAARLRQAGISIQYVPSATARHVGGHSVGRLPEKCRVVYWYASLLRYAAKHFRPTTFRVVCGSVIIGCWLRAVAGIALRLRWEPVANYSAVIRFAVPSFFQGRLMDPVVEEGRSGEGRSGQEQVLSRSAQRR